MNWRALVLATFIVNAMVLGIYGSMLFLRMVAKLNAVLPPDRRFDELGWWMGKYQRFRREYDVAFPDDPRMRQLRALRYAGVGAGAFAVVVATLLFGR